MSEAEWIGADTLAGLASISRQKAHKALAGALADGRPYVRATLIEAEAGPPLVTPFPVQDSSMLSTLGAADCLLIRPPNAPVAKAGDRCRIVRLP